MSKPPTRTLGQLTDEELMRGINHYEWKILGRAALGIHMTRRDKELIQEWEAKITVAKAELKRRQPKQEKLL